MESTVVKIVENRGYGVLNGKDGLRFSPQCVANRVPLGATRSELVFLT